MKTDAEADAGAPPDDASAKATRRGGRGRDAGRATQSAERGRRLDGRGGARGDAARGRRNVHDGLGERRRGRRAPCPSGDGRGVLAGSHRGHAGRVRRMRRGEGMSAARRGDPRDVRTVSSRGRTSRSSACRGFRRATTASGRASACRARRSSSAPCAATTVVAIRGGTTRRRTSAPSSRRTRPRTSAHTPRAAGPYGHEDLAGNVWEWIDDDYDPLAYSRAGARRGQARHVRRDHRWRRTSSAPRTSRASRARTRSRPSARSRSAAAPTITRPEACGARTASTIRRASSCG